MKIKAPFRVETESESLDEHAALIRQGYTVSQYLWLWPAVKRIWWVWSYVQQENRAMSQNELRKANVP